jgi:transposase-like protein
MAVERMKTCESVTELARELGVRPRCHYKWRAKLDLLESGEEAARASTHEGSYRKQVLRLKQLLAEKTLEVDFSKVPCKKSRLDAGRTTLLARRHLRANPRSDALARQFEYRAHV